MDLIDKIENQACFVSGIGAYFRTKSDLGVSIAMSEAETLLNMIPAHAGSPIVSGGTTKKDDHILFLYWSRRRNGIARDVAVSIKSNGLWDLSLWGEESECQSLKDMDLLDLALTLNSSGAFMVWHDPSGGNIMPCPVY